MTLAAFAVLAASCAMAIMLVVDLRVPFRPIRAWLRAGPQVHHEDEHHGPWWIEQAGEPVDGVEYDSLAKASAQLSATERLRAWGAELSACPYCAGAHITALALVLFSLHAGVDVLWFWPALWWTSAVSVVVARAIGDLP